MKQRRELFRRKLPQDPENIKFNGRVLAEQAQRLRLRQEIAQEFARPLRDALLTDTDRLEIRKRVRAGMAGQSVFRK